MNKQDDKLKNKKNKRKKKNGIWFNDTATIENFAQAKSEKIEKVIENIIFFLWNNNTASIISNSRCLCNCIF